MVNACVFADLTEENVTNHDDWTCLLSCLSDLSGNKNSFHRSWLNNILISLYLNTEIYNFDNTKYFKLDFKLKFVLCHRTDTPTYINKYVHIYKRDSLGILWTFSSVR